MVVSCTNDERLIKESFYQGTQEETAQKYHDFTKISKCYKGYFDLVNSVFSTRHYFHTRTSSPTPRKHKKKRCVSANNILTENRLSLGETSFSFIWMAHLDPIILQPSMIMKQAILHGDKRCSRGFSSDSWGKH